ncbi:DUF2798 domain-containing protein [Gorillibacterium sp. CAU 1737]|uniref:DUF2798 domain-containing protein n=1 Tax=Gorillibacterium sp. CAU 1737 TaxID=3140362 RepID=UPI003260962B
MPSTKKEQVCFCLMMCFGMVTVMTIYNLALNGALGSISFFHGLLELAIGFSVAFILDFFLVGPAAKKVAFRLPFDKSHKGKTIVAISTCMVLGMALCMSVYGLSIAELTGVSSEHSLVVRYLLTFLKNVVVAIPLQLVLMGPVIRFLFGKLVKGKTVFAD